MSETPLYYSIIDFKSLLNYARPIDVVNSANVMDMINSIQREGREVIAILLDKKGIAAISDTFKENFVGIGLGGFEGKPLGYTGMWYGIPLFTDCIDEIPDDQRFLTNSYMLTGKDGVVMLSASPQEVVTFHVPDVPDNVIPREVDPYYDHTLDKPVIRGIPLSFKDKIRAVVSANVRSQFREDSLNFVDSNYDTQHFNIEPIVEGVLNLLSSVTEPTAEEIQLPPTLTVIPNVPHHAQNLPQLQAELAYWTAIAEQAEGVSSSVEAQKQVQSCTNWISRRNAEIVADQPKL